MSRAHCHTVDNMLDVTMDFLFKLLTQSWSGSGFAVFNSTEISQQEYRNGLTNLIPVCTKYYSRTSRIQTLTAAV